MLVYELPVFNLSYGAITDFLSFLIKSLSFYSILADFLSLLTKSLSFYSILDFYARFGFYFKSSVYILKSGISI